MMTNTNQSGKARHVIRTRMLLRLIVFLHIHFSICVRCSILILLIKTVCCSIPHCIWKERGTVLMLACTVHLWASKCQMALALFSPHTF